jgi:hypothetical protein
MPQAQCIGEGENGVRQCVKGLFVIARSWNFGETEAGKIRRDYSVGVSEARD